ncbi:MAG: DUF2490 domain-containing protein [Bacteroidia bacterium]|nr:DUF2490 domain-containing protein [Bacteroidia bacterium]NNM23147.1 DUF2490 domain-containing protein [Flavobacteriaceae bacterium]
MIRKGLLVLVILLAVANIHAQDNGEDKFGTWLTYFGNHQIADKWSIFTELQVNHYQFLNNYNQFWTFIGMNHRIDERSSVSAGYAYFNTDPSFTDIEGQERVKENRIYEQFVTRHPIGTFNFNHRYRLEQRFFAGNPKVRHRIRYRILLTHPIKGPLFAQVFDEIFLNFQEPTFDQNRIFLGLGYRFTNRLNLRLGYLKVHFSETKYDRLQLFLNINTDLRKKKEESE